jgi:hypothetical protein
MEWSRITDYSYTFSDTSLGVTYTIAQQWNTGEWRLARSGKDTGFGVEILWRKPPRREGRQGEDYPTLQEAKDGADADYVFRHFTGRGNPKQGYDGGKAFFPPWYKQHGHRAWETTEDKGQHGHFHQYRSRWIRKKHSYSLYRITRTGWGLRSAGRDHQSEFLGRYRTSGEVVDAATADWSLRQFSE